MKYVRVIEQNGQESIALFPHSPEKVSHKEALAWLDFKEKQREMADGKFVVRGMSSSLERTTAIQ